MTRICFYGGPGVGKSTLAALTYGWLRQHGHSAELVQEWIKDWAYLGREVKSFDYVYTFANQLHMEDRLLQAGVKWIVTDSPVLLQCMYALNHRMKAANELWRIAKRFETTYPSVNFVVTRSQHTVYEQIGRYETREQALAMDRFIVTCLHEWHVPFKHVLVGEIDPVLKALTELKTPAPKSRKRKK